MDNVSDIEMLKFAFENGMLDIDTIQKQIEMNERKKYLDMHSYKIWQGDNGLWYTYLPDVTAQKGRKLKKRKDKHGIENSIIDYYKSLEEKDIVSRKNQTLKDIFPRWIDYKTIHTESTSYIARIIADWNRFYLKEVELINMPLKQLEQLYLDNWAHEMIKKYQLTKKSYYNMSVILRQCLDYAVYCGDLETNAFSGIKINTKLFKRTKKKPSETQVYSVEEEKLLVMDMFRRFNNNPSNTAPLAVVLCFEIGVRIGELCALKFSDIERNYVNIQRQEVREYEITDGDKTRFKEFKIVDYTKSEESYRAIYLTETARKIVDFIKKVNLKNQEYNPDNFIFVKNGKNINHYSIQAAIENGCNMIGIPVKTCHKIRKTYISTLIDSNLNIDQIRRMAGHTDERTTYGNYCYNRMTDIQTERCIENAMVSKKVIKGNQFLIG